MEKILPEPTPLIKWADTNALCYILEKADTWL